MYTLYIYIYRYIHNKLQTVAKKNVLQQKMLSLLWLIPPFFPPQLPHTHIINQCPVQCPAYLSLCICAETHCLHSIYIVLWPRPEGEKWRLTMHHQYDHMVFFVLKIKESTGTPNVPQILKEFNFYRFSWYFCSLN